MATATDAQTAPETVDHPPYEMTTDEFFRMIEAGAFDPHRRVYLWHGRLCEAMAKTVAHAHLATLFSRALHRRLPDGWFVASENPLALNLKDAPLPDFTVAAGEPMDFLKESRHVTPGDVAVVVEIAVTSLPRDMGDRKARYALAMSAAGGTYVVVDAGGRCVWVHKDPGPGPGGEAGGVWGQVERVGPGGSIRLSLRGHVLAPIPWEEVMR